MLTYVFDHSLIVTVRNSISYGIMSDEVYDGDVKACQAQGDIHVVMVVAGYR